MSSAFGDGFQSQLLLVAQTPDTKAKVAWTQLVQQLPDVRGVASMSAPAQVGRSSELSMVTPPRSTSPAH